MNPWAGGESRGNQGDGEKLTDLFSGSALEVIPIQVTSKDTKDLLATLLADLARISQSPGLRCLQ